MSLQLNDQQLLILKGQVCPYCKGHTLLVDYKTLYHVEGPGHFWACFKCKAWVGCHKGTDRSLGRLANFRLRQLKIRAHLYFDMLWQKGHLTRPESYAYMAQQLGIDAKYCHMGYFSEKTCEAVILYSKQFLNDMRRLDIDLGAIPSTPWFDTSSPINTNKNAE